MKYILEIISTDGNVSTFNFNKRPLLWNRAQNHLDAALRNENSVVSFELPNGWASFQASTLAGYVALKRKS